MTQSNQQLINSFELLEEAILSIDTMIRRYKFVTKMSGVRTARIKLEQSSKILKGVITSMRNNTPTNCYLCDAPLIMEMDVKPDTKQDSIIPTENPVTEDPAIIAEDIRACDAEERADVVVDAIVDKFSGATKLNEEEVSNVSG